MFVGHNGEIYPCVPAGPLRKFPTDPVVDAYQNHPTFKALRTGQLSDLRQVFVPPRLRREPVLRTP